MKIKKNQIKNRRKAALLVISACIAALLVAYIIYAAITNSWPLNSLDNKLSENGNQQIGDSGKPSIDPTIEHAIKSGSSSGQDTTSSGGVNETGASDIKLQSKGTTSGSGVVTLFTPVKGQSIKKTVRVTGSSATSTVYYRISDDVNGMIGNGQLAVNAGLFSGDLSVSTSGSTGTFEVYSFNDQGQEINNIYIEITY